MPIRTFMALMILAILTGCGGEPQPPAEEAASTPGEATAQPAQGETPPADQGMTFGNHAGEQPAITPPVEPVEIIEELGEAVEADHSEDSPPPDQPETDQPESGDKEETSTGDADDPVAVEPPAPPAKEPPAIETDDENDDSAAAPPPVKEDQPEQAEAPVDPVTSLLDELERTATDLRTFTADVLYQTEDALLGQQVTRRGSIIYRVQPEADRKSFAILFDQTIESGRLRERRKHYIFDDRWLVEVDHAEKTFIKREIVPPGRKFDPLKLGEGPFPLPIGQARQEVLSRFEVSLIDLPREGPLAPLAGTFQVHGLRLRPKSDAQEAGDYHHIDLFYDKQTLLPVGVEVIETNDDRKTARLDNLKRNVRLTDGQLEAISVAEPNPTEWRIDVRPWQAEGG